MSSCTVALVRAQGRLSGKTGIQFAYYVCGARHRGQGCTLPYLSADDLEARLTHA